MNTPIDWLRKELEYYREFEEFYTRHYLAIDALFNEAKEKEKEHIMNAYLSNHLQGCWMDKTEIEFAEEYYNEIFKK